MRIAQIDNGVVVNVLDVNPHAIPDEMADWPEATEGVGIGWVYDGADYAPPAVDPAEELAKERAAMSCSRMQGILTLGEEKWGEVLTYRETATWAEKVIIDDSGQWERLSENIEFIGYLVGYSDERMDDLFRAAMQVVV